MSIRYFQSHGQFNLCSNEKQWQVGLYTPFGNVGEVFEEEQSILGSLPSDILDLIEERLNSYWINTGRKKKQATIDAIREHADEIDATWLDAEIARHKGEVERLEKRRSRLLSSAA